MNDIELSALVALVNEATMLMGAENEQRWRNGFAPAWTAEAAESDETRAIREELKRRSILPASRDGKGQ